MLNIEGIVACICEGYNGAEHAIMDLLLEHDLLIFNELLDDKIIPFMTYLKSNCNFMSTGLNMILKNIPKLC